MIKSYTDPAANERTYLAWARTDIAAMAFGFPVDKFELLLGTATRGAHGGRPATLLAYLLHTVLARLT